MEGDLQTDTLENNAKRATVLPSRYNAAEHDLVTPVKDQNPYGTCWAFSALSACETSMIRKGLQDTSFDLSEFHFAYFFFHTQEDALGGTAGDCTLLADPDTWMSAVQMPVQCLHSPNGPELLRNPCLLSI